MSRAEEYICPVPGQCEHALLVAGLADGSRRRRCSPAPRGAATPARSVRAHWRGGTGITVEVMPSGASSALLQSFAYGVSKRRCSASDSSTKPVLE